MRDILSRVGIGVIGLGVCVCAAGADGGARSMWENDTREYSVPTFGGVKAGGGVKAKAPGPRRGGSLLEDRIVRSPRRDRDQGNGRQGHHGPVVCPPNSDDDDDHTHHGHGDHGHGDHKGDKGHKAHEGDRVYVDPHGRVVVIRDGVVIHVGTRKGHGSSISGHFGDDRFNVGFHVGGGLAHDLFYGSHRRPTDRSRVLYGLKYPLDGLFYDTLGYGYGWYGSGYGGRYGYRDEYVEHYVPVGGVLIADPRLYGLPIDVPEAEEALVVPTELMTTLDKAQQALVQGESARAVELLSEHLGTKADDAAAMRLLAVALIDEGRLEDATAMMAMAYREGPWLVSRALDMDAVGGAVEVRERVRAMVRYGHKVKTGSAWLSVAVLMQAEGRRALAGQMAERAREHGLEDELATSLVAATR